MSNEIIDSTAVNSIAELEKQMAAASGQMATSGAGGAITFMSAKSGMLNVDGQPIPGNSVDIVIIDAWAVNTFYGHDYDPDNLAAPACIAFNRNPAQLAPCKESSDPKANACNGCAMNEWGSAAKGKGKACKNTRVVVFGMADAVLAGNPQLFAIRLPVTSVKGFTQYTTLLGTSGLSTMRVRTQLKVVPDSKTQFKVTFAMVEKLPVQADVMILVLKMFAASGNAMIEALTPSVEDDADKAEATAPKGKSKF